MADEAKIGTNWHDDELDAIVTDYFEMLTADLSGQPYVKSKHNAALMTQIGRTHRSVEFKHQNISAVLDELGMPWIPGYKPKRNYQNAIFDAIDRYLSKHPDALETVAIAPAPPTSPEEVFVAPPPLTIAEVPVPAGLTRLVQKFDPVARDLRNRSLGLAGEEFVLELERRRLTGAERSDLARKIRWIAVEEGDGAGYDTLAVLCSSFNDAPSSAAYLLLERAKDAGIRSLDLNAALLVLPRPNEALAVKDEAGVRASTIEDGYDLKSESASMALQALGLENLTIGFFNAFGDDPARLRNMLLEAINRIRQSFRARIEEAVTNARSLLLNHEQEQVQEVLRSAAQMMQTWVSQHSGVPKLSGHVQDSLMSQIQIAYASTVRATVRREGEWHNLSCGHHLGYGARRLAVLALEPLVEKFKAVTETMHDNPEYADAKGLVQQARRVLESAFEDLLRKVQIMGQTAFKEALKLDPSLWVNCENEWGQGPGYRDRVAGWNELWFGAESRQELEQELRDVVVREWGVALKRLSSLLETDAGEPAEAVV